MAKISACVISYNEEATIGDCLASLAAVADEIVVVDSGSTDRTREIAADLADRVIEQPFLGYKEQKNFAVKQAQHDWILSLDCDERLSPQLTDELLLVKSDLGDHAGYSMPRRNFYVDRWLDHCTYPDRRIRLFDRKRAHWAGTNPHDSVQMLEGEVLRLDGDILHYSCRSVSQQLQTIDRFSEIAANQMYEAGRRGTVFSPLLHGTSTFMKLYVLKRGFLDGFGGLVVSVLSGMAAFVKYAKLLYLQRADTGTSSE
jgi:glycosyltransferase involved in cell wall biosynthesis